MDPEIKKETLKIVSKMAATEQRETMRWSKSQKGRPSSAFVQIKSGLRTDKPDCKVGNLLLVNGEC